MFGPLVHTSGTFNTLMSVFEARPIVLFEKFDVEQFLSALRRYRPKFAPLPPTALQMILDSNATREDFTGMLAVRAGTAALPVDRQIAFEDRFGVPVLTTYGATEFMGVVTSWTLQDHRKYSRTKRGSVGRTGSGVQIRIVDQSSGEPLEVGQSGILEAKLERIDGGLTWIRTTDLGTIDSDGFLYISGRADDAIIRGGFKMMAGKISDVLRTFPGVNDVVVVGRPDARLGEVPIAVVEATEANTVVDSNALKLFAKQHLNPYEVPLRFYFVERLPRTVSDKVSKPEVQRMLDSLERSSARQ
jgi:acyl-CoA synthetase (AMP-forming)/AMP-acid ligase II